MTGELEQERVLLLKEQNVVRLEELARLQRDFQISMFQARESELEMRIEELEEINQDLAETHAETSNRVQATFASHVAQIRGQETQIERLEVHLGFGFSSEPTGLTVFHTG